MSSPEILEKKILIFLAGMLLVGVAVTAYKRSFPAGDLHIKSCCVPAASAIRSVNESSGKININKASAAELTGLKGIGPALAGRIVKYRSEKGLFISKEDLKKVPGIGDKLFSKVRDDISLE